MTNSRMTEPGRHGLHHSASSLTHQPRPRAVLVTQLPGNWSHLGVSSPGSIPCAPRWLLSCPFRGLQDLTSSLAPNSPLTVAHLSPNNLPSYVKIHTTPSGPHTPARQGRLLWQSHREENRGSERS